MRPLSLAGKVEFYYPLSPCGRGLGEGVCLYQLTAPVSAEIVIV